MPAQKLRKFLDEHDVAYVTIAHSPAYTTQGIAQSAHLSGKAMAKTVILRMDGTLVMAVLPGNRKVDLAAFARATGATRVELATEQDFSHTFPGCELGAMPPFGNLWDVPVYVSDELAEDEEIAFNAGTHTELIRLAYEDFARLVDPTVVTITHALV